MSESTEQKPVEAVEEEQKATEVNSDVDQAEEQVQAEEAAVAVPPVIIQIVSPTSSRALPKTSEPLNTLTLLPQSHETVQELKLAVNEWVGGYWLGPYSLRIPKGKGKKETSESQSKASSKDGVQVAQTGEGDRLSEWLEVGDVFAGYEEADERVLEVVREPYTELTARQHVQRLLELIAPPGTSASTLSNPIGLNAGSSIFESIRDGTASEPTFEEVEVALAGKKSKGKKEVVKVKKEAQHPFADWKDGGSAPAFAKMPISQEPLEVAACLRSIQVSPFNPPPPHLRQKGHQLYLQVSTLEGETQTLICTSRGWYVSKSNVNTFDPSPRADGPIVYTHSAIDLLHTISPLFSERLAQIPPLSSSPPALEPISTVPIPQAEPAYPFLATTPKPSVVGDIVRSQLAYLHTGALSPDALDGARDWNEEIQGIKELPRSNMQERVLREKMAQKTWAEFTAASVRSVLAVARGDVPPLNPNEDANAHMFLTSNIFVTKAVDSIDIYSHLGGDAAAHVSHAKDAEGVRILNRLDVDGVHLLGHTVVDWAGERWVCQSMLPGIFSRPQKEDQANEPEQKTDEVDGKKEDWVQVSPTKSSKSVEDVKEAEKEELAENPLIVYGLDSETTTSIHWDAATHKVMSKIATAQRLAAHEVQDGSGKSYEFYASAEVKGLKGTDGRRYLLDLPRISPVDVEWLEKDIDGKLVGSEESAEAYPHRVVLLRPELVEMFWESELKRWARDVAAKKAKEVESAKADAGEKVGESSTSKQDNSEESKPELDGSEEDTKASPAASAAAAQRAEAEAPLETSLEASSLAAFNLRLNPDAFVDQAPAKDAEDLTQFVPSKITDESDPTIKAVRDASVFLRQVAIPAVVLDTLTGNTSGVMDGASLSKHLHGRGINIRYLGHLVSTIDSFSAGPDGQKRPSGHLTALKSIVVHEMVFRGAKHVLRSLLAGLASEHASCAIAHFLNCILGTGFNASPQATYDSFDLGEVAAEPAYTKITPESVRKAITKEVASRFRWAVPTEFFEKDLKKRQILRELAMRTGFQLVQQDYAFDQAEAETINSEDDKENKLPVASKDKKDKKKKRVSQDVRRHTFEPSDILALIPIVRSTAPVCTVAEEIFDAGRATINRGSMDLGLEFLLESVQLYESIYSVIHPEVAAAYNSYTSTIHQLARIKIQQMAAENGDPEQPLGLDISTAIRLQRQAVIIAERTLGVYHAETCAYYFNLAMLENLEGNAQASLRYFRHVLNMWEIIHGPGHTEINTVLANAGVVLQAMSEHPLSLTLLLAAHKSTSELFGEEHIQTGQSLHQLTQAHFLAGDIPAALAASEKSLAIFEKRLGAENAQTKEVARNVELLRAVVDNVERQKAAGAQARERQLERLHAAQARVGGTSVKKRLGSTLGNGSSGSSGKPEGIPPTGATVSAADAAAAAEAASRIGERGHMDVDELVKYIQGGPSKNPSRGKNALRGKRRTGAKR